jgi:valyl-tRNA synthetase
MIGEAMPAYNLPKTYDFSTTEKRLYEWWETEGFFSPVNDPRKPGHDTSKKPFVISIPPPNVTGELHLGHALFLAMEDLMVRYHRMKGDPTLWVPGSDHAGIATQLQVEKMLESEGKKREEIGREEFVRLTWEWKEKYGGIITRQIRRLGASCDWTRERFTLDEGLSRAVREAFVHLYEKNLIYRGPRMINWSPGLKTAVSDLEVESNPEPGTLYYFKYMLVDVPGEFIPVATTRPETILGDTAVAVHPEDPRYQQFVGRQVRVPILAREIPVIADDYVTREFGTGALKITPGHDPNDYLIGKRHNLPLISMLDESAKVNENGGPYSGMDRFDCRKAIWNDMKAAGLVLKEEPYTINVPRSQRGGEIIEPMVSTQWFVRMETLAEAGISAVRDGLVRIIPDRFTKVYYNWLENIQDWCISRQLWWGHRIPVWYCKECGAMTVTRQDPTRCSKCNSADIYQDEDVLDTWFSSALWPFSTLGWPEETPDLKYFYPTSVLETGYDILFFWVARMIMAGFEFTEESPFNTVYLHGLIRDEFGQKMSKTKGNAIDPLVLMDEMGTDALRFTLLVGSTPGNDINMSAKKVEANRNFANKIWNVGRFIIGSIEQAPFEPFKKSEWSLADSWIWARLKKLVTDVNLLFETYQFGEAGRQIYEFFWGEFADWYIEIAKIQINQGGDHAFYTVETLVRIFDICLRMLHPFTPFITEELWGHLKNAVQAHSIRLVPNGGFAKGLIVSSWPEVIEEEGWENQKIADFGLIQDIIRTIRNIRTEKKLEQAKRIGALIVAGEKTELLRSSAGYIAVLASVAQDHMQIVEFLNQKPAGQISMVVSGIEIYLPLAELIDLETEKSRLTKELNSIIPQIDRLEILLRSSFIERAPATVVDKEREKLKQYKETAVKLRLQLMGLG